MADHRARTLRALAFALLAAAAPLVTRADETPAPVTPSASPVPRPKSSPPSERLAIASCGRTYFYIWPVRENAPSVADYPPATNGDAFHVVGGPQLASGGLALYQTTIDVVEPWGAGKHYWVDANCVNAG